MAEFDLSPYLCNKDLLQQQLQEISGAPKNGKYHCPDPNHQDQHPSANIYSSNGKYKWKCHSCGAGGDYVDLLALASGRTVDQVIIELKEKAAAGALPPKPKPSPPAEKKLFEDLDHAIATAEHVTQGKVARRHTYTNPDTHQIDLVVLRIENATGKTFFPIHPVEGGWHFGQMPGPRPLYNRGRIRNAHTVLVVEGEKCVEYAQSVGIVATTSPGGSQAAGKADWSPLEGKNVVIWRDNDERKNLDEPSAGEIYQADVINALATLRPTPTIRVVDPAAIGMGPKQDIADFINRERKEKASDNVIHDVIQDIMDEAPPFGASAALYQRIEDTIAGRVKCIEFPFPQLTNLTRALLPGTVTILCGDPGSAKSFFLLQCMMYWHLNDIRVALFELEDDKAYHLQRALCHLMEDNSHFDPDWIAKHAEEARAAYALHQHTLDQFAICMDDDPDVETTLDKLAQWVAWRCEQGARILAIDPITIVDSGSEPWNTERLFMARVKRTIRHFGASLILVTHPKKNRQNSINLDQLAGSTAFPRFAHSILWLEHLKEDEKMMVVKLKQAFGAPQKEIVEVTCNRRLHLCKTRNGRGHGLKMAYHLFGKSMLHSEQGIIESTVHKN